MYRYKQGTLRNSIPNNRSRIHYRRLIIIICWIILIYLCIHLIQTGIFLIKHFIQNDDINDMIQLDINTWKKNSISKRKIPRYIHQIWISSKEPTQIYQRFAKAANYCVEFHSDYNYTLWTHDKLLNWLENEYPWFLSVYNTYRYDMQRIDAMKYFLLFHFGGLYIDLDIKCNIRDLITAMIPKNQTENEPDIIFHMGGEGISANTDIMAAKQSHPFFKLAINRLKSANRWFYLYHLTIILSAGPTFLYGIYRTYPSKEDFYFIPNNLLWGELVEGVNGATWYGTDTLVLIFFMQNKFFSCCLLFSVIISLMYIFIVLRKKIQ
jgi:mannosyltransferase OCH1-like enzyme